MSLALIYVRQSHNREYERTVSPEDQEAQCRALPAVAACDTVELYRDLDLSGGSVKRRKGLTALLERIKAGGVTVVAALDQSRSFRSLTDALEFYALMEKLPSVQVVFVKGSFDRSAAGGFTWATFGAAHEMERRMTGEKTASALRFMIARGQMVGPVGLGFRRVSPGPGQPQKIELDAEWAPVIQRIFSEYAAGDTTARAIALRLNAEGLRPPGHLNGFRSDTLAQMLRSPIYIGMMPEGGRRAKGGQLVKGDWPALIDLETWEKVQATLNRFRWAGGGPAFRAYPFQGLLRCADCGGRMYAHTIKGLAYYHCRNTGARAGCGMSVRETALLPWGRSLLEWLEQATSRAGIAGAAAELAELPSRPPEALAQVEQSLERIGQRFEWGDISADEYREKRERALALRAEILAEAPRPVGNMPAGLVAAWDKDDAVIRRALIANVFSELDVSGQAIVTACPRADVAAEVSRKLENWPGFAGVKPRLRFA